MADDYTKVIHKYELDITDVQTIDMPIGAEILSVQEQRNHLVVWALVWTQYKDELEPRKFYVIGTGNPVPEPDEENWPTALAYVSTVQTKGGRLVWHVFTELDMW